jgi:hypothetical protein
MKSLDEIMRTLPADQREAIEARARELAEEQERAAVPREPEQQQSATNGSAIVPHEGKAVVPHNGRAHMVALDTEASNLADAVVKLQNAIAGMVADDVVFEYSSDQAAGRSTTKLRLRAYRR